jgi:hypothetical protein
MNPRTSRFLRIIAGIIAANLAGAAVCVLFGAPAFFSHGGTLAAWAAVILVMVIWPSLVLVPMGMGLVAAYFWRKLPLRIWEYLVWWSAASLLAPLGGYLMMREGLVCLIIGFPILFIGGFGGVMLGRFWFRAKVDTVNLSVFPLLVLAILAEGKFRTDRSEVATDQVLIRAESAEVWKHVVAFPPIAAPPNHWLNLVGLPSPVATTCEGAYVGADRRCIFSDDLVFKETVSELIPERLLTFDIVEQPPEPELLGHLTLHRGQFELKDNGDGTTTLIGRSWYTLHMRPRWYFDWWTRDITSHVHLRVMKHIKTLSERSP